MPGERLDSNTQKIGKIFALLSIATKFGTMQCRRMWWGGTVIYGDDVNCGNTNCVRVWRAPYSIWKPKGYWGEKRLSLLRWILEWKGRWCLHSAHLESSQLHPFCGVVTRGNNSRGHRKRLYCKLGLCYPWVSLQLRSANRAPSWCVRSKFKSRQELKILSFFCPRSLHGDHRIFLIHYRTLQSTNFFLFIKTSMVSFF